MIICLEGLDYSGKSTQVKLLKEAFPEFQYGAFPDYTTDPGKLIRNHLDGKSFFNREELFTHFRDSFIEGLKKYDTSKGKVCIFDRYTSSTLAYQATEEEIPAKAHTLHQDIPYPDVLIYLKAPLELLLQRKRDAQRDAFEANTEFMQQVASRYDQAVGYFTKSSTVVALDATLDSQNLHENIARIITHYAGR